MSHPMEDDYLYDPASDQVWVLKKDLPGVPAGTVGETYPSNRGAEFGEEFFMPTSFMRDHPSWFELRTKEPDYKKSLVNLGWKLGNDPYLPYVKKGNVMICAPTWKDIYETITK